jgi:protein-disulfide isomerase
VFLTIVRASLLSLLLFTAAGCSAQSGGTPDGPKGATPAVSAPIDAQLARRIETQLRTRYTNIPSSVHFKYGTRRASEYPGYDVLPITLYHGEREQTLEFLISKDDKAIARPDKIDVAQLVFSEDKKTAVKLDKLDISALPDAKIDVTGRPVRGNPNAKVSVIVYDDFQCPFCAMMHDQMVNTVLPQYGDKLKVVYKDYPLTQIHPWATPAAVNANCIGAQNGPAYWEYADKVHADMDKINKNDKGEKRPLVEQTNRLAGIATEVGKKHGLDAQKLNACLQAQDDSAVKKSHDEGDGLGVDSTPTLFINGERIAGAAPIEDLRAVLDRALIAAGDTPPPPPPAPKEEAKPTKPEASKPKSGAPSPKSNEKK